LKVGNKSLKVGNKSLKVGNKSLKVGNKSLKVGNKIFMLEISAETWKYPLKVENKKQYSSNQFLLNLI
jgi:hypothetical protein